MDYLAIKVRSIRFGNAFRFFTISDEAATFDKGQKYAFEQAGIRFVQLKLIRIYFGERTGGIIKGAAVGGGVKQDRAEPGAHQCDIRVNSPRDKILGKFSHGTGGES